MHITHHSELREMFALLAEKYGRTHTANAIDTVLTQYRVNSVGHLGIADLSDTYAKVQHVLKEQFHGR